MKERAIRFLSTIIMLSALLSAPITAAEARPYCEGPSCFPSSLSAGNRTLTKTTEARYRYWGLLVFDAALYLETPEVLKQDFLGRAPCALKLCYRRTLSADDFRRSGAETLALNPEAPIEQMQSRIDQLHGKYREMHDGDCYQLNFTPGIGLELVRNGESEITIPGDDFARHYLGIWLSKYSFSKSLAKKLTTPPEK